MSTAFEKPTDVYLHQFHELARVCEVAKKESTDPSIAVECDTTREILHELAQPLTAISSFGAVALNSLDRQVDRTDQLRMTLQQMVNAANLAAGIITRFRDANQGRQLQTEVHDITHIVKSAVELLIHPMQDKAVRIRYSVIPAQVDVDPVQIQEVLINLIRNSIEAIPYEVGRIEIHITEQFGQVVVSIEDNGPGIDSATREALFRPVASAKENGMGIGLAVSRSIIESHGGKIWCSDVAPHGTRVQFTLPMPEMAYNN